MSNPVRFLTLTLACLLLACSPQDEPPVQTDRLDTTDENEWTQPEDGGHQDMLAELKAQGWRPATVTVRVEADLAGNAEVQTPERGGTRMVTDWHFNLNAHWLQDAWMPPNPVALIPDYTLPALPRSQFAEIFYYIPDDAPPPRIQGQSRYTKNQVTHSPKANDFTSLTELVEAHGDVLLEPDEIRPSFYGIGLETGLQLEYNLSGTRLISSVSSGGSTHRSEEPCCEGEQLHLKLYPQPHTGLLTRLTDDDADADMPAEWRKQRDNLEADMLAALVAISGSDQVRVELHPGVTSRVSPDEIELEYNLSGAPLVLGVDGLDLAAAPAQPRRLQVVITVRAQSPGA